MTNVTTDGTTLKGFPNFDIAERYMKALEEAAIFLHSHQEKENLPEEILSQALGSKPPYCDCTNINSMLDTREAFNKYQQDKQLFIERALIFAQ